MQMQEITTRFATQADIPIIMELIMELATFEKEPHAVITTVDDFKKHWNIIQVILGERDDEVVGMAFMYESFSTWVGPMSHLEDLIVREKYRRQGIGQILFDQVIQFCNSKGYKRLKWEVLDWNQSAIEFYKKYDAHIESTWLTCRLKEDQLSTFKVQ